MYVPHNTKMSSQKHSCGFYLFLRYSFGAFLIFLPSSSSGVSEFPPLPYLCFLPFLGDGDKSFRQLKCSHGFKTGEELHGWLMGAARH